MRQRVRLYAGPGYDSAEDRGEAMRTWILISALMVASAINPDFRFPPDAATIIIVFFVVGLLADVIEFYGVLSRRL